MSRKLFGANLRTLRKQNAMTQCELADRLGIKQTTISEWERLNRNPSTEMLKDICKLFDVKLDEILNTDLSVIPQSSNPNHRTGELAEMICDKLDRLTKRQFEIALWNMNKFLNDLSEIKDEDLANRSSILITICPLEKKDQG